MRTLFVILMLCACAGEAQAIEQDQIFSVNLTDSGTVYVFTYGRTLCKLSLLTKAVKDEFQKNYNYHVDGDSVYVLTPDSLSQSVLESFLNIKGVSFTKEIISLSTVSKADIMASGITEKKILVKYISMCAQLRADNVLWSDKTVRAVARGSVQ